MSRSRHHRDKTRAASVGGEAGGGHVEPPQWKLLTLTSLTETGPMPQLLP